MFDYIHLLAKLFQDKPLRQRLYGFRPVVMCILTDLNSKNILLVKPAAYPQLWILPQEGFSLNESPEECAIRCLQEELGFSEDKIHFRKSKWVGRIEFDESRKDERDVPYSIRGMVGKAYFSALIRCNDDITPILNKSEISDYAWVHIKDIDTYIENNTREKVAIMKQGIRLLRL